MSLSFSPDGHFRIVQFNDTQDTHLTDRRTIEFMEKVLDQEQPNFALINGDVISGGQGTNLEVYQSINNVVMPMESRGIPWAITFGNHEEDSTEQAGTTVFKPEMVSFVRQYEHNVNPEVVDKLPGCSNGQVLIDDAFAIWLLDSGRYISPRINAQSMQFMPIYDYIRPQQVQWFLEQATKVPGLLFFHIPTYEHADMWNGGPGKNSEFDHYEAVNHYGIVGEKNEAVDYGAFNSGIFAAALERGDIVGIYCGHDHINSYKGTYYGIELGFSPGTGFGPYGFQGEDKHRLRGARVFDLDANSSRVYQGTRLVLAKDLGLDMTPEKQPIAEPVEFPDYVRLS
ncbi:metallophosphoesterase family protein [Corynebacterium breve]|uniref:Metallophosphoesterase family protein n=1 Tax=Corynebacterium breve TaxID=3049799 RepID=A0ABY8VJ42_9CORY|nr:metallophosphoesterase family protein [Corynebacterium breve]WIM68238.1 metallophosphoesterase family protein [Corynebacterium breve]